MKAIQKHKNGKQILQFLSLLAALLLSLSGGINRASAAGMLVADGGFGGTLDIIEHSVAVTINNGIAVTHVNQVFKNRENRQIEALYTFPVPKGASVANFSMWINGKEMVGEVVEKKRAREIYNSYKQKKRDPGLLEQTDYKTFEMRIFPIAANAEQRVQISYYQELDFDHDWATWVYPLATSTGKRPDNRVKGRFSVSADIKSVVPIIQIESPSHGDDFVMINHSENYSEASLENQAGDLARDVVLAFQISRPVTGMDLLTSKTGNKDGYFALTLTAGRELEKAETGSDYVFVLDISGSMATKGKLSSSVKSLAAFISNLGAADRFEVIAFNKRPYTLFDQLQDAGQDNISKAVAFLNSQEAKGGTSLQSALTTAYKYGTDDRSLNTVILSDGITEQDERPVLMSMIRSRPANVRVFCIGVGNEIDRSLLKQMAEDAGGMAAFISRGDDFERQARAFRRKLMHPVASDLQITINGLEVYDIEPEQLPSLYFGMPVRMYGRYKGRGTGEVLVTAEINGRPLETRAQLQFPKQNNDNPEIERMWAWQRMEQLKRRHEMNKDSGLVDEIVRLGEAYSITSEYTSFLVLENDAEYQRWKIERRNAVRIVRDRDAQQRLRRQLDTLRSGALDAIGPDFAGEDEPIAEIPKTVLPLSNGKPPVPLQTAQQPSRSFDMPAFSGGGAMDPFSALLGLLLAGSAFLGRKKKQ